MENLTPIFNRIETALKGAERPEVNLLQMYRITNTPDKEKFIICLIGKLIELDRRLRTAKGNVYG